MKLKAMILGLGMSFCVSVFATNQHAHPDTNVSTKKNASTMAFGFCEIEIINRSYVDVTVSGIFDDGFPLPAFNIYSFEQPHTISLYYDGYCHAGMNLYINTFYGDYVYSGYAPVGRPIYIVPYLANQAKSAMVAK